MQLKTLAARGIYLGLGILIGTIITGHTQAATHMITTIVADCNPTGASSLGAVTIKHVTAAPVLLTTDKDSWKLTVTGVAQTKTLTGMFGASHAKGKFLVVFMTAQNVGKAPANLLFDQEFSVVDSAGQRFSTTSDFEAPGDAADQFKLDHNSDDVQPSFTIHTAFVFDVALGTHGFTLQNTPLFSDSSQTIAMLGV